MGVCSQVRRVPSAYLPLFETYGLAWAGVGTGCCAGICSPSSSICFNARLSQLCESVAHTRSSGREGANDWCKKQQEQCHMRIQLRGGADKYAFPNTRVTCILDPHTFRREGQGATRHLHARDDIYEISGGDIAGVSFKEGGQVGRRSSSTEDYATLALVEEQVEGRDKEEGRDGENQVLGEGRASKLPPTLSELTRTQKGKGLGGITSLTRSIQRACPTTSLQSPSLHSPSSSTLSSRSARRKKGPVLRAARCEHVTNVNGSVVECRKRPCYGPPFSTAVRCSQHQKDGDQDVTNPRCQWGRGGGGGSGGLDPPLASCKKLASYGGPDTLWRRAFCTAHRSRHHVNVLATPKHLRANSQPSLLVSQQTRGDASAEERLRASEDQVSGKASGVRGNAFAASRLRSPSSPPSPSPSPSPSCSTQVAPAGGGGAEACNETHGAYGACNVTQTCHPCHPSAAPANTSTPPHSSRADNHPRPKPRHTSYAVCQWTSPLTLYPPPASHSRQPPIKPLLKLC